MRHKSLYEYMLGVRQWRHVALRHGAFCVSRQHRLCRWWPAHFHVLFMKGLCVYSSMKQCLQSVNHEQFRIQMTQNNKHNKWLEFSIFNRNSSGERRLKFIASGEDDVQHTYVQQCYVKWFWTISSLGAPVYSKIIFFDATIRSNSYTICTMHVKNIFPLDWGQPISLLHHGQHWVLQ